MQIARDVHWVGVLDPQLRIFDVIVQARWGTTYNSYLVVGQEKVALIDTVKAGFEHSFFEKISQVTGIDKIDYIVLNHLEPDHSGALGALLQKAPQARVVVSRNGAHFVRNLLNRELDLITVGDGDSISLGGKTLQFISAPFLHWPDTMFTFLAEEGILFPCDAFGCHFCHEAIFDDLVGDFSQARKAYYDQIMRPFGEYVLKAYDKIKDLDIEMVAPSHGPVLRTDPRRYIDEYVTWSSAAKPGSTREILVLYVSAYGNTEMMARAVVEGAVVPGVAASIINIAQFDPAEMLRRVDAADAIIIGSPTINGDALKPVWDLLSGLATIKLKGKVGAAFGSYGWSGEAVKMIEERLKGLKFSVVEPGVRAVLTPKEEALSQCRDLGRRVAEAVKAGVRGH
ncbi:MAG TPA: FprA family A-type flavoprotein [Firmicutes bacterium]|nr:FprA family A-type flavoprotein [Bacillota bacterium]